MNKNKLNENKRHHRENPINIAGIDFNKGNFGNDNNIKFGESLKNAKKSDNKCNYK